MSRKIVAQRSKNFMWTLNNYTEEEETLLKAIDCKYMVWGYEVGASGTPHLQGSTIFKTLKTVKQVIKLMPCRVSNIQIIIHLDEELKYCRKDGNIYESGVPPCSRASSGQTEKERWELARTAAKENRLGKALPFLPRDIWKLIYQFHGSSYYFKKPYPIGCYMPFIPFVHHICAYVNLLCPCSQCIDDVPADIYLRMYRTLKEVAKDHMKSPDPIPTLSNRWVCGPSGCGKSRSAREQYPGAYYKMCNKWWDGYQGESTVIIEDIDTNHKCLIHHLKLWGDHGPFLAETKGGAINIRPERIIVTSNCRLTEMAEGVHLEAMQRRYEVTDMFDAEYATNFNPPPLKKPRSDSETYECK